MKGDDIKDLLEGNLNFSNSCCEKVSHALISNEHQISTKSDYFDKDENVKQ